MSSDQVWQDKHDESLVLEKIQKVLDQDEIEDERAQGIARQVIKNGLSSLSKKQKYIFDIYIQTIINKRFRDCAACNQEIDIEEDGDYENDEGDWVCTNCHERYMQE